MQPRLHPGADRDPTTTTAASCATRTATCASSRASSPITGDTASFVLDPIEQEIVTCTIWNSFDYDPTIGITKVNAPTAVRGDITPPATVTSSYAVTNPGNTPLSNVRVVDDKCAPVTSVELDDFNVGDIDDDNLLDVTEVWEFTCTRPASACRGAGGPDGHHRQRGDRHGHRSDRRDRSTATDTDDVDVYFPDIALTKLVDDPATAAPPAESVIVEPGTP